MNDYERLWRPLSGIYEAGEAKAIIRYVLEVKYGFTSTDLYCGKITQLSANQRTELEKILQRLQQSEPVQYVLGEADFAGRCFKVRPGGLIPRPETEELCQWIIDSHPEGGTLLDLCTGSGCIAVTLALEMKDRQVWAWDIAPEALQTAEENNRRMEAGVHVEKQDVLRLDNEPPTDPTGKPRQWDLMVSNPPYVCEQEKAAMESNVLSHEPHLALFVPDDDPLRFYLAIARYARRRLTPGGWLYFEINPLYATQLQAQLEEMGFGHTETRKDGFGKERMMRTQQTAPPLSLQKKGT